MTAHKHVPPSKIKPIMIKTLELLRNVYHFGGYIHVKAIPGADNDLITRLELLADRMSINIELPSQESLKLLAPNKTKESILRPMGLISAKIQENSSDLVKFRHASKSGIWLIIFNQSIKDLLVFSPHHLLGFFQNLLPNSDFWSPPCSILKPNPLYLMYNLFCIIKPKTMI